MKVSIMTLIMIFSSLAYGRSQTAPRAVGMMKILQQLDLTDEQKAKVKELRTKKKDKGQGKANVEEVRKLREELKEKYASDASDSEVRKIHDKIDSLRSSKSDVRFERMMELRSILTVEQRKKLQELMNGNRAIMQKARAKNSSKQTKTTKSE